MNEQELYEKMRNAYIFNKGAPAYDGDPDIWNRALERLVHEVENNIGNLASVKKLIDKIKAERGESLKLVGQFNPRS